MDKEARITRNAETVFTLASEDQRIMDLLRQRPHLLSPYPSLLTRLARRSRRFRQKLAASRAAQPSAGIQYAQRA